MILPQRLAALLDVADLTEQQIDTWLLQPSGKCECGNLMARWERLNGACQECHPLEDKHGCSCSLNRPHEWGSGGWHTLDDGEHGSAWERCPKYERVRMKEDALADR